MKKLKIGVIGAGFMGSNHARVYSEIPDCKIVAISDIDEKKAKAMGQKYNCSYYKDYKEMLDKEEIEAASVTVPTKIHKEVSSYVMDKNIHVLLEKPIAGNIEDAQEIIKKAKEKNVKLLIGHIERFNPVVIKMKELIDKGKLGKIITIIARRVGSFPLRIKDANIVVDVSVHDIDIINYLLGKKPDKIHCFGGMSINDNKEDQVIVLMKYDQTSGVIQSNWITPIKIRNLSVTGTKGYAELNYLTQELVLYKSNFQKHFDTYKEFIIKFGKPKKIHLDIRKKEPLKEEITHFIKCAEGDDKPVVDGYQALTSLKIALEINNKLRKNKN